MYQMTTMTWAETGSYPESKISLSLYRSLLEKDRARPEVRALSRSRNLS